MRDGRSVVSIAAVVLAAGSSSRFGQPKQLVRFGGEPLLERAVRVAHGAGCSPIVVVLGAMHEQVVAGCSLAEVVAVINDEWEEGMSSSIRLGVHTVGSIGGDVRGVVIMTCDQPAVSADHLQRLMGGCEVRASRYAGRNGVPVFFPKECFAALAKLAGDTGARELLRNVSYEDLPGGEVDVDTVSDLERARQAFE